MFSKNIIYYPHINLFEIFNTNHHFIHRFSPIYMNNLLLDLV
jgi:hypothetical protein